MTGRRNLGASSLQRRCLELGTHLFLSKSQGFPGCLPSSCHQGETEGPCLCEDARGHQVDPNTSLKKTGSPLGVLGPFQHPFLFILSLPTPGDMTPLPRVTKCHQVSAPRGERKMQKEKGAASGLFKHWRGKGPEMSPETWRIKVRFLGVVHGVLIFKITNTNVWKGPGAVAHARNPSAGDAGAAGSGIPGQGELQSNG